MLATRQAITKENMKVGRRLRAALALVCTLIATQANAALQTWRLEAVAGWTSPETYQPPEFARPGSRIVVDYLIDDSVPANGGSWFDSVLAVTLNGETTSTSGYLQDFGSFTALNAGHFSGRTDGVHFLSLNVWGASDQATVTETLFELARTIGQRQIELRLDIGSIASSTNVYATASSLNPVPLPAAGWLFAFGLPMLLAARTRRKAADASQRLISRRGAG